jgi:hypothetical protein
MRIRILLFSSVTFKDVHKILLITFWRYIYIIFKYKKSQRSHKTVGTNVFLLSFMMIEGSGIVSYIPIPQNFCMDKILITTTDYSKRFHESYFPCFFFCSQTNKKKHAEIQLQLVTKCWQSCVAGGQRGEDGHDRRLLHGPHGLCQAGCSDPEPSRTRVQVGTGSKSDLTWNYQRKKVLKTELQEHF